MNKCLPLAGLMAVAPAAPLCQANTAAPNILFIICDDLNDSVERMGGHPQARTPNIDRLMRRGVRFTNAQCNSPLSGPSRASLWSGFAPQTTAFYGYHQDVVKWRDNPVMKDCVTLFEHAARNGFRVFGTGKLHHTDDEDWKVFVNADGTDGFRERPSWGPYPWDGVSSRPVNFRGLTHPSLPAAWRQGAAKFDFSCSFGPIEDISGSYDGRGRWILEDREPYEVRSANDYDPLPDEKSAAYAAKILRSRQDQPFFLAVGFCRPHVPLHVPKKYFDMFPIETVELSPGIGGDVAAVPDAFKIEAGFKRYHKFIDAGGIELLRRWTQAYLASIAFVDEQVGVVLDALEKSGAAENTLVIFVSDNGYHMGEKELNSKNSVWERSMRVPLVIAGPGVAKDRECTHPVSLVDLYPTCVDYGRLPENPNGANDMRKLDGHTLRPFLENPGTKKWAGESFALSCSSAGKMTLAPDKKGRAADQHWSLRTEYYRYVRGNNGAELLYDYRNDPHEWTNLAGNPAYAAILEELRSEMKRALQGAQ